MEEPRARFVAAFIAAFILWIATTPVASQGIGPSVESLSAQVVTLKQLVDERDRLYTERAQAAKVAVDAAFVASTKGIETALAASTKALEAALAANKVAVDAAFAANKELTAQAFVAAKEAVLKAEVAQEAYNKRSNEFRATLDDANKANVVANEKNVPRVEYEARVKAIERSVGEMQSWQSGRMASAVTSAESLDSNRWTMDKILSMAMAAIGWLVALLIYMRSNPKHPTKEAT